MIPLFSLDEKGEKSNFSCNDMEELLQEKSKWSVKGLVLQWDEGGWAQKSVNHFPPALQMKTQKDWVSFTVGGM